MQLCVWDAYGEFWIITVPERFLCLLFACVCTYGCWSFGRFRLSSPVFCLLAVFWRWTLRHTSCGPVNILQHSEHFPCRWSVSLFFNDWVISIMSWYLISNCINWTSSCPVLRLVALSCDQLLLAKVQLFPGVVWLVSPWKAWVSSAPWSNHVTDSSNIRTKPSVSLSGQSLRLDLGPGFFNASAVMRFGIQQHPTTGLGVAAGV
jgi:hypothetical protein